MMERDPQVGHHPAGVCALEALVSALTILQNTPVPGQPELLASVRRVLVEVQALIEERARLRALLLDCVKAYEAPDEEQWAVRRRVREEIASG